MRHFFIRYLVCAMIVFNAPGLCFAETEEPKWNGQWINSYLTNPHESSDPRKKSSLQSSINLSYRFSEVFRVQGTMGFTQILEPSEDFNLINPEFRGFYQVTTESKDSFKIEVGPTLLAPLSSESRSESHLFSIGTAARFTLDLQEESSGGFLAYYDLGINFNINEYQTSAAGDINQKYSLNHYLYFEYDIEGPFLFDIWIGFSSLWNELNRVSNAYTIGQEALMSVNDWLDVSISHERGGDYLSTSGQTYNFGLFDASESRYALNFTINF